MRKGVSQQIFTSRLAPFKKLAQTIRQYWAGIVSYFQCRITQGAVEAINGIIQLAKRRARGFRNFLYLRVIAYCRKSCPILSQPLTKQVPQAVRVLEEGKHMATFNLLKGCC